MTNQVFQEHNVEAAKQMVSDTWDVLHKYKELISFQDIANILITVGSIAAITSTNDLKTAMKVVRDAVEASFKLDSAVTKAYIKQHKKQ